MGKINKVRINPDILDQIMKRYHITTAEFCERIGYSKSWWGTVLKKGGYGVKPVTARLICTTFGLDYDKLVVPDEPAPAPTPAPEEQDIKNVPIFTAEEMTRIIEPFLIMAKAISEARELMLKAYGAKTEENKE